MGKAVKAIDMLLLRLTNLLVNMYPRQKSDRSYWSNISRNLSLFSVQFSYLNEKKSRVADPDPVGSGVFAWIRIRFSNFSGSGSGFQISLDPDPVSAQILEQKKMHGSGSGSGLS